MAIKRRKTPTSRGKPISRAAPSRKAKSARAGERLLDVLPVAFALFDAKGVLVDWNAHLTKLKLFPKQLLRAGTPIGDFRPYDEALSGRVAKPRDLRSRSGAFLRVTAKRFTGRQLLVTWEDVTDARKATERLDLVERSVSDGIYDWDIVANRITYSDRSLRRSAAHLSGRGLRQNMTGRAYMALVHPEDRERVAATTIAHFKGTDDRYECEYRIGMRGRWRWFRQHGTTIRDAKGRALRMTGATTDITERKEAELALARAHAETAAALERQTATAEILKVIAGSPADVQPVFEAIVRSAARLFDCGSGITVREGDRIDLKAVANAKQDADAVAANFRKMKAHFPIPFDPEGGTTSRVIATCTAEETADTEAPGMPQSARDMGREGGYRSIMHMPLARAGTGIGVLSLAFEQPDFRLDENQRALLQTFADQAAIAIENVRLFNETKEALAHQSAAADVLQVISQSVSDAQPVFEQILDRCQSLIANDEIIIDSLGDDGMLHWRAGRGSDPDAARATYPAVPPELTPEYLARGVENHADVMHGADVPQRFRDGVSAYGRNVSLIEAAIVSQGRLIGTITAGRFDLRGYTRKEERLLKTFADQAAVAIENARLFRETQEALERQTATAEILKIIAGSPDDVQPVLDGIARSALRLVGGRSAVVLRAVDGMLHLAALTETSEAGDAALRSSFPVKITGQAPAGRAVLTGQPAVSADVETDPAFSPEFRQAVRSRGTRGILAVPMLRDDEAVGTIVVTRAQAGPFTGHQVRLLQTFADQAVIAIENVRLFNETKEALERQTATAEILRVISESPTDTQPVFDAIAESARKLLSDAEVGLPLIRNGQIELVAVSGLRKERKEALRASFPRPLDMDSLVNRTVVHGKTVHHSDSLTDDVPVFSRDVHRATGVAAILGVPLLRKGTSIGGIFITRTTPGPFSDKQIELLRTFADQAVIAIENVRLFNETKEALERQTATAEILKVIAGSPSDVQPVFDAIAHSAIRLVDGHSATVTRVSGDRLHLVALTSTDPAADELVRSHYPMPLEGRYPMLEVLRAARTLLVRDTETDPAFSEEGRHIARARGFRTIVYVPMLRDGVSVGVIHLAAVQPNSLTEGHVRMLETFADQAVIAIENVRLFNELQDRTNALTNSVGQLTALGEVSQALSSTLDLEKVLATIVSRAVQLTGLDGGALYEYDEAQGIFLLRGGENLREEIVELNRAEPIRMGDGFIGQAAGARTPVQVPDLAAAPQRTRGRDVLLALGFRALLAVPLVREGHVLGALAVARNTTGEFAPEVIALLQTFATQSAIAIQNARLFREIEAKSRQLEEASQHKSQFLASMSHELRTPLNAILGFNEMILSEIYGEVPEDMKPPLEQTQSSGRHLLGLINNVLDLAKIEANRMELAPTDYLVQELVATARATLAPLAEAKGLALETSVPDELPLAYGDTGRLAQCLINLAGNAIKFTREGSVRIAVEVAGERLRFSVADTGMGIAPEKIGELFTEFKQTDATIAREYGGTGLGLAITKKFIELHGGSIRVESELGHGSDFIFEIPLRVQPA